MWRTALLVASLLALEPDGAQDGPAPAPPAQTAPAAQDELAKAAWQRVVQALAGEPDRAPIQSFALTAEVRVTSGRQSNELDRVSYRYKAPDLIRFGLSGDRETGRGPVPRPKGAGGEPALGYWLRDKDLVVELEGRDYQQDRALVRRMTTIAQNVVALSDPGKLRVTSLELKPAAPASLPPGPKELVWKAQRCDWIELTSPDFDLYREAPAPPPLGETAPTRIFRVTIGVERDSQRPYLVVLREEAAAGQVAGEPLLFELSKYAPVDGYLLPHTIRVRGYEPKSTPPAFQEAPAQEIGVIEARLNAPLSTADFAPKPPEKAEPPKRG